MATRPNFCLEEKPLYWTSVLSECRRFGALSEKYIFRSKSRNACSIQIDNNPERFRGHRLTK